MLSYSAAGEHVVLSCDDTVLLTDAPIEEVKRVWEDCEEHGGTFEQILTSVCSDGVTRAPNFVLVAFPNRDSEEVHVAVRGEAQAVIDGQQVSGGGATTWNEQRFPRPHHLTAQLHDTEVAGVSLPLRAGMVQAGAVEWACNLPDQDSQTVLVRTGEHEYLTPVAPGSGETESPLERTVVRRTVPHWMLRFTTGQVIGVGDRVVVGRRPAPTVPSGEQLEQLLSPQREVSANHALLTGETDGVLLTDLDSTNGTVVRVNDGPEYLVHDGQQILVREGDQVDFGDGNIAECVRATPL